MLEYLLAYMVIGMVVSLIVAHRDGEFVDTIYGLIAVLWPMWVIMTVCLLLGEAWERWKKKRET